VAGVAHFFCVPGFIFSLPGLCFILDGRVGGERPNTLRKNTIFLQGMRMARPVSYQQRMVKPTVRRCRKCEETSNLISNFPLSKKFFVNRMFFSRFYWTLKKYH